MGKQFFVLVAAVVVCAVAVVELRHRNRQLYVQLQALQSERDAHVTEWGQLLLEEGAWSQHRRIEATARSRLGMDLPDPRQIVVIRSQSAGGRQ
ncbi:MAG: hypothetical protein AMJ84_09250 [Acidithiobacillales bacterium SM23_46]|jgi:cell division protein FtsL|nr:MAG: hypothetical protein AMJ84_09250 [Acidithiobacillales bacterium SM23_46]KPL28614.1 MAG: hypothetical protein AMJ72_02440 [Acidithiobacillales bacterium SM1_46]